MADLNEHVWQGVPGRDTAASRAFAVWLPFVVLFLEKRRRDWELMFETLIVGGALEPTRTGFRLFMPKKMLGTESKSARPTQQRLKKAKLSRLRRQSMPWN